LSQQIDNRNQAILEYLPTTAPGRKENRYFGLKVLPGLFACIGVAATRTHPVALIRLLGLSNQDLVRAGDDPYFALH